MVEALDQGRVMFNWMGFESLPRKTFVNICT